MTANSVNTVAVIGLGEMGSPKAHHLLDAGFDVRVYDVRDEAMDPLVEAGAERCASPADAVKEADVSLVVVLTEDQVWDVISGTNSADGIMSTAQPGHLVIVSSTISPIACKKMATTLEKEELRFVDAPTARGGDAAEQGELLVFLGADQSDVPVANQIISTHARSDDIIHLGPVGSGAVGKAINNMILFSIVITNYEGLRLAKEFDVDLDILRKALLKGSADNWSLCNWDWQHMKTASKDLSIVNEMIEEQNMSMPLAELTYEQIQRMSTEDLDRVR